MLEHPPDTTHPHQFTMVEDDVLDALDGDHAAAHLVARIKFRAGSDGWWTATRAEVLADARLTPGVLRRLLPMLREAGWVETERVRPYDPTLRYRVLNPQSRSVESPASVSADSTPPDAESAITEDADSATTLSSKNVENKSKNTDTRQPTLALVVSGQPTTAEWFDQWWRHYPRKVGKRAAAKAFAAAAKRAPVEDICRGLGAQLPTLAAMDPRYVKHPTTWLNQDCWEDDVAVLNPPKPNPWAEQPTNPWGATVVRPDPLPKELH